MNEIELIDLWKKDSPSSNEYYEEEIESKLNMITKTKSKDIMERVNRTIKWEFSIGAMAIIVIFFGTNYKNPIILSMIGIIVLYYIWSFRIYKDLFNDKMRTGNIRESLDTRIDTLSRFIKKMRISSYWSIPLGYSFGIFITLVGDKTVPWSLEFIGFLIVLVIVLSLITLFFVPGYLKRAYGNHLEELKTMRSEIDS